MKEIIGYAEPWILSPGETTEIKISSTEPTYSYRLVRAIQGHEGEHAPPVQFEEVKSVPGGRCNGREQTAYPGSYGIIPTPWTTDHTEHGLIVGLHIQPYLVKVNHTASLVSNLDVKSKSGFAIVLTPTGILEAWIGCGTSIEIITSDFPIQQWRWHEVTLRICNTTVSLSVKQTPRLAEMLHPEDFVEKRLLERPIVSTTHSILLAAGLFSSPKLSHDRPSSFFNGRIDSPYFLSPADDGSTQRVLAIYDFSLGISTDEIFVRSGFGTSGRLVNAPTRAVKGFDWDGSEPDWTKAKYGYGAIHFHEDDLDDADWATDFSITIPEDARSGAYLAVIKADNGTSDMIPLFVRPTANTSEKANARVAIVLSTFTYLAYANEHIYARESTWLRTEDGVYDDDNFKKMRRRTDLGLSLYDKHIDLSGAVFSSAKRPLLNVRPGYVHWGFHRPREFSADLLMIGFLERLGIGYDVVVDHDLHERGVEALRRYTTVITGSHPEYPSMESLNAYSDFTKLGGSLMYLGGNGFYWCSATASDRPHRIEVRRGDAGCRSFECPPGERVHSLNGQLGGLWRSRGRAPNYLFGVGSVAGGNGPGVPYARTKVGLSSTYDWVFSGITKSELIGVHGFGGGASGDEIDKMDYALGSPSNTVVLATSTGHTDQFGLFNEEILFPMVGTLGSQTKQIRSDMTYYDTCAGGGVFAVGSINWYNSLGWDDYHNNVARITENVLRHFLRSR